MDEEHKNFSEQMRQMLTAFDKAATDLIRARETYLARGYDTAITDTTLGPGMVTAADVLNINYIVADLDTFMNPGRLAVIAKLRTDY